MQQEKKQPPLAFQWIIQPYSDDLKGGLAIGNIIAAKNIEFLNKKQIKAIITVMGEEQPQKHQSISYFKIIVQDNPRQNIAKFFQATYCFINHQRKFNSVLVHCRAGVSRSATIICAFLMKKLNIPYLQTIQKIKKKKSIIEPNRGFLKQLSNYQQEIKIQNQKNANKCLIY